MMRLRSSQRGQWSLADTYDFIAIYLCRIQPCRSSWLFREACSIQRRYLQIYPQSMRLRRSRVLLTQRYFHDYFVTNLPSSSLHPDSRSSAGPHHKLPRLASIPHTPGSGPSPAAAPLMVGSRDLTVVRIPLRSAKHHFGVSLSRGTRPYNEDTYQAGTIEIPAFAKRAPISLTSTSRKALGGGISADSASGDPQVFYFGVFDGHGGNECSEFLREELHSYIESTASLFELASSLKKNVVERDIVVSSTMKGGASKLSRSGEDTSEDIQKEKGVVKENFKDSKLDKNGRIEELLVITEQEGEKKISAKSNLDKVIEIEKGLVQRWKDTVGGYFRRFKPDYFSQTSKNFVSIENVLMYAFLKADLDFVSAQARKPDADSISDQPLNADDILGEPAYLTPSKHRIGGPIRFVGGSTASIAIISTPTPTPFWNPASTSTMLVAHVGDTRIILCDTATGLAKPCTTNHHPSSPGEGTRLRRYAATFVTDSFGEERMSGLANTRSFGDMRSKRIGVSAEPEIHRIELSPAEYSMLVLVSDGVSGTLSDQEIIDVVKEAKTPEQGARDVVALATEVSRNGDNATCLVVRLGGWERRSEGGVGSLGTREGRDWRRNEAGNGSKGDGFR